MDTDVAAALVATGALERMALSVLALDRILSALSGLRDRVPRTLRAVRLAALAAFSKASVSATPSLQTEKLAVAGEAVTDGILAADVILAYTTTAAAFVSSGACSNSLLESVPMRASLHRLSTPCGRILRTAQRQK